MKKRGIAAVLVLALTVASIIFAVLYLRGGALQYKIAGMFSGEQENPSISAQNGEPDDASTAFAEVLKSRTGVAHDANYIVSTGVAVREGNFTYEVNSWSVQKEPPAYPMLDEARERAGYYGADLDREGTIQNDLSYVVVNLTVENQEKAVTNYIWGTIYLKTTNAGADQYMGEMLYLGEDTPREYDKDYYREVWQDKESKTKTLIYLVRDEWLTDDQLYLEINSSGVASISSDYDPRRYIILN